MYDDDIPELMGEFHLHIKRLLDSYNKNRKCYFCSEKYHGNPSQDGLGMLLHQADMPLRRGSELLQKFTINYE